MSVSLLLEMAASSNPDRTAVVSGDLRLTTQQLSDLADGGAGVLAASNARHVVYIGTGGAILPLLIFAAARAGLPFTPINYRLSADVIQALIRRLPEPLVIADDRYIAAQSRKPVQVTTQLHIDGRRVAEAVSEHQAREWSRPLSGATRFDGRMSLAPVAAPGG